MTSPDAIGSEANGSNTDFFMLDIERDLAGDSASTAREHLIEQYGRQLAAVKNRLRAGVPAGEYPLAEAWRVAMESSIRVIREVRPKPI
jgi:hypothetical protein